VIRAAPGGRNPAALLSLGTQKETVMKPAILAIVLNCTASVPAFAQGLPALEGNGAQTQSVELANGAVSVSVESQGDLSLNRGEDTASGALGITVNGVSVELGGNSFAQGTTPSGRDNSAAPAPVPATQGSPQSPQTRTARSEETASCHGDIPSADQLAAALAASLPVRLEEARCVQARPIVTSLLASQPALIAGIQQAGLPPAGVVAITIDNTAVILGVDADNISR